MNTLEIAEERISALRGRSTARTLDSADLHQALIEAASSPYGLRAGATVANCYGYPASRMRLVAVRLSDGDFLVLADWGNAKKGSSTCPLGGRQSVWARQLADIASGIAVAGDLPNAILVAGHDVRRLLATVRREARAKFDQEWPETDPDLVISVADSIEAGNCEHETTRVAEMVGATSATTATIRRVLRRHAPHLARFARRAEEIAARRMLAPTA